MMTRWILGTLLTVLALPTLATARLNPPIASRAAQAQWKASLQAARLQQLQVQRQAALARREAALAHRQALLVQRQATTGARLATRAGSAASPAFQSILQRFQTLRSRNPVAFDRQYPTVSQVLRDETQLRVAAAQGVQPLNGLLPDTPLNRYLHWRRSLAPARFDYYHPTLGPILAEDERLRNETNPTPSPGETLPPPVVNPPTDPPPVDPPPIDPPPGGGEEPPPILPPPIGGGGDPPPPGGGEEPPPPGGGEEPPPAVPEPGAILLFSIGLGVVGWCSRKRRRTTDEAA